MKRNVNAQTKLRTSMRIKILVFKNYMNLNKVVK